jgi:plastocyanin
VSSLHRRFTIGAFIATLAMLILGPLTPARAAPVNFGVYDAQFYYPSQTALVGQVVTWENMDNEAHRIVSYDTAWSKYWTFDTTVASGGEHLRRVRNPGVYAFRDPANSTLVRRVYEGRTYVSCQGMCGILRVR